MNNMSSLGAAISEKVLEYFYATGVKPIDILVSPGNYRQLLEAKVSEQPVSLGAARFTPLREISTPIGRLGVVIDELLSDAELGFDS